MFENEMRTQKVRKCVVFPYHLLHEQPKTKSFEACQGPQQWCSWNRIEQWYGWDRIGNDHAFQFWLLKSLRVNIQLNIVVVKIEMLNSSQFQIISNERRGCHSH